MENPKKTKPEAADVLYFSFENPGTFYDFCDNFGYDTDSRKAFGTYQAVVGLYAKAEKTIGID